MSIIRSSLSPETSPIVLKWALDQLSILVMAAGSLLSAWIKRKSHLPRPRSKPLTRKGRASALPEKTAPKAHTALPKAGVKRKARND